MLPKTTRAKTRKRPGDGRRRGLARARLVIACLFAASVAHTGATVESTPEEVIARATRAADAGRTLPLEAEWSAALRGDPTVRGPLFGLAILARLTCRPARADSLNDAILARAPEDRFTACALLERGLACSDRDVRDSAIVWFERAHDVAHRRGDLRVRITALLERAPLESYFNRRVLADSLVRAAGRLVPAGSVELEARVLCARAATGIRAGDPAAASAAARAAELAERCGARRLAVRCRFLAADARGRAGQYDAVWQDLAAVATEAAALHDLRQEAITRFARGTHLITYGVIGVAQAELRAAEVLARRTSNRNLEAWICANEAQAYYYLGEPEAGGDHARRAIEVLAGAVDPFGAAFATALRGDLAAANDELESAARWYEQSAAEFSAAGYPQGVAHASELLATVALRFGDLERSERLLRHAWELTGSGMAGRRPEMDLQLGTLALRRGRWADAESFFRRGRAGEVAEGDLRYHFDARLAELRLLRGDTLAAEETMRRAGDAFDAWRATLPEADLRSMAFQAAQDEVDPDLGVATVLAAIAALGRVSEAFSLAEQRRARDLGDRLLRLEGMRTTPDSTGPARHAVPHPAGPLTADAFRRALPDSVALLEFVTGLGGEPTTVLLLTGDTARAFVTDPVDSLAAEIEDLVARLAKDQDAREIRRRLGAGLLQPAVNALPPKITTLLLVPDGELHRVPFDALLLAGDEHVFERFATGIVPSATVALSLWRRPARSGPVELLAFGDPTFVGEAVADDDTEILRSAFAASGGLPRLRASGAEARRAAAFADRSLVLLRESASETRLKGTPLARFRVIHFATHALVDDASSARSALALAPGGGEDGFVGPGDLAALTMPADLVVLSACRTARGRLVRGEGLQGLTAPLLVAGARSLLATQWPIADRAAWKMTEHFYRGLSDGATVAEALRSARQQLALAGAPASQWGAFVLIGDPAVRLPLHHPPGPRWPLALGALALAVLGGMLLWWRSSLGRRPTTK